MKRLLLVTMLLAACSTAASPDEGFPRIVNGMSLSALPERIVSGSPTHTEILFAIGAGDRVVAVDTYSDHPAAVAGLPHLDAYNPSVEGFAALDPDLVVVTFDPNDLVGGLGTLGIPVLVLDAPDTLEGVYEQITLLGEATGTEEGAAAVVAGMRAEVTEILAGLPTPLPEATYYHELDPSYYSIGSDTFLGSLYTLLGLRSIADAAGGGYPQLSAEFILAADPDFVFLGDASCCGQSPEVVATRPGWGDLSAVAAGRVLVVDESLSSRWGPRVVDLLRTLAAAVHGVAS